MDTDIRKYIRNNLKDCDTNDVKETVLSSVNTDDEVVLPGLGVLFEIVWNGCDEAERNNIINIIYNDIKKA